MKIVSSSFFLLVVIVVDGFYSENNYVDYLRGEQLFPVVYGKANLLSGQVPLLAY